MKIVIDIPEYVYKICQGHKDIVYQYIANGTPLPKGHSFIAICDSDFPITEEVKQELKNTTFVGNEDCNYCFDMTEIIKADKTEREKAINEWLGIHCRKCANNDDRGTDFVNCQAECEVQKDIGIACIHYDEYVAESGEE